MYHRDLVLYATRSSGECFSIIVDDKLYDYIIILYDIFFCDFLIFGHGINNFIVNDQYEGGTGATQNIRQGTFEETPGSFLG